MEGEYVTMAGQSYAMIGWSWTEVSVLGSQVFEQALMESCESCVLKVLKKIIVMIFPFIE